MKVRIKNSYKRNPQVAILQLLQSLGFVANEKSRYYKHIVDREFYGADTSHMIINLETLTYEPLSYGHEFKTIKLVSKRWIKVWVKEHLHRFTSKKFGI